MRTSWATLAGRLLLCVGDLLFAAVTSAGDKLVYAGRQGVACVGDVVLTAVHLPELCWQMLALCRATLIIIS